MSDVVKSDVHEIKNPRKVLPALGLSWSNIVMTRIMLTRTEKTIPLRSKETRQFQDTTANIRTMETIFSPHMPNRICYYTIDEEGVKGMS